MVFHMIIRRIRSHLSQSLTLTGIGFGFAAGDDETYEYGGHRRQYENVHICKLFIGRWFIETNRFIIPEKSYPFVF